MTSENDNEDKPLIIAESTEIPTKKEDETVPMEKVKRVRRKKLQDESTIEHDTQPLFEQPVILEGKRSRKPTSRLELAELSPPRKELSIPQGNGKPLGEIPYVNHQLLHVPLEDLTHLRSICFGRRASKTNLRQHLQEFKGFAFTRESEDFQRHLNSLTKLKKDQLEQMNEILGLDSSSDATKILEFLLEPKDLGKTIVERAKIVQEDNDNDDDESIENGDEHDTDYMDDDAVESDEDFLGGDDDEDFEQRNNDDPDDFAYQPGRKAPKKKSKTSTTTKRKRATKTKSKRNSKKRKVPPRTKQIDEPTTIETDTNANPKTDEENGTVEN